MRHAKIAALLVIAAITGFNLTQQQTRITVRAELTALLNSVFISNAYASGGGEDVWTSCGGKIDACQFTFVLCYPCDGYGSSFGNCQYWCLCRSSSRKQTEVTGGCYGPRL